MNERNATIAWWMTADKGASRKSKDAMVRAWAGGRPSISRSDQDVAPSSACP